MAMDESRDEELVYQSLDDENEGAFEILYHRYEMSLLNFFYRRVGSWETAQDLMQENVYQSTQTPRNASGSQKVFELDV